MNYRNLATALAISAASLPAAAASNIDNLTVLSQSDFRLLSEDLGAALSYKPLTPAVSTGMLGFDIGLEATVTKLVHPEVMERATSGSSPKSLVVPKIHAHKGLPLGFDVGAFYASIPSTDIKLVGAEVRYALLEGSIATPAIALRGSYSRLSGLDQLDFRTAGIDLSISKGFAFFTPYAGVGLVQVTSTPNNAPGLSREKFNQNKVFVGANLNLLFMNFALEADRTGKATTYGAKVGFRF